MAAMDAEIWQRLPHDLVYMILARLPIRVLGKMRTVCKEWKYLLSSRDAFEGLDPTWSLRSNPGFLIHIHWDWKDDVEYWVMEGRDSDLYKVPLLNHLVVETCKSIFCCHRKGDKVDLSIGIPGTKNWRHLPRPPISAFFFNGLAFDSSTRRCTLLLGNYCTSSRRMVMCIYDSESNAWTQVSMRVPDHIRPVGKGVYFKGKFHWVCVAPNPKNLMITFNIADRVWDEIPLPQGCRFSSENIVEYNEQVVLVEHKGYGCVRILKLNEKEVWCDLHSIQLENCSISIFQHSVTVNNSGLISVMDRQMNISIYNLEGKLRIQRKAMPGLRSSKRPYKVSISSLESNNLLWPESS